MATEMRVYDLERRQSEIASMGPSSDGDGNPSPGFSPAAVSTASMGPSSDGDGNVSRCVRIYGLHWPLQWGRRLMATEIYCDKQALVHAPVQLQWGRRLMATEIEKPWWSRSSPAKGFNGAVV